MCLVLVGTEPPSTDASCKHLFMVTTQTYFIMLAVKGKVLGQMFVSSLEKIVYAAKRDQEKGSRGAPCTRCHPTAHALCLTLNFPQRNGAKVCRKGMFVFVLI